MLCQSLVTAFCGNHVDSPEHSIIENGFRMRGVGMTRIDAFSDVVFGFALSLLVVSLEVPKDFSALHEVIRGFIPFAICFSTLLTLWYAHYVFFRRYGLHDQFTILLNSCLLFVVLFYVYPLKFLFTTIFGQLAHHENSVHFATASQVTELMLLYGLGFAAVYVLLAALYWNAWRQRDALTLNGLERLVTISAIVDALGLAAIGLLAAVAALLAGSFVPSIAGATGYVYFLIAPWKTFNGMYFGRKVRALRKLVAAPILQP
jgi:uncharacterized membrane protein